MLTLSDSTSLRAFVRAVAGRPSLSSRITSSLRPASCQPLSSQKNSQPLYMSLPACAMAPESGARNPILIGPWASAAPLENAIDAATMAARSARMNELYTSRLMRRNFRRRLSCAVFVALVLAAGGAEAQGDAARVDTLLRDLKGR